MGVDRLWYTPEDPEENAEKLLIGGG